MFTVPCIIETKYDLISRSANIAPSRGEAEQKISIPVFCLFGSLVRGHITTLVAIFLFLLFLVSYVISVTIPSKTMCKAGVLDKNEHRRYDFAL